MSAKTTITPRQRKIETTLFELLAILRPGDRSESATEWLVQALFNASYQARDAIESSHSAGLSFYTIPLLAEVLIEYSEKD